MASSKLPSIVVYTVEDIYEAADSGKQLSDYDVTDEKGYSALMQAVQNNSFQAIRALLESGADLNLRSSDSHYTVLSFAVEKGHINVVRELLQYGPFLSCEKGIEALDMAIQNGFLDAVVKGEELLIKQNKEIIMNGKTGVFQAFKKNRLDLVKNLVIAGSYISLMHESTYTYRNSNTVLLQQLINDGIDINIVFKEKTALVMAILFDSPTCVEMLLKSKANVNFVNKNKWTPLHFSAERQNDEILQMLIDAGADVNAETCEGETPLHLAASRGDIKTIQLLVAAGGSVNCSNNDGDSGLMNATKRSSNVKEICTYLVKSGANVNLPNKLGVQPIVNIVDVDCLELMQLFIEHGSDVNACDSMGRSVLSLAIWTRKREITRILLLSGANVNFMFKGEVPLLVMAVKLGDVELVNTMLEMGADVTKGDINGNTPLHVAVDEFKFSQSLKSCLENRDQFICVYSIEGLKLHLTPHDFIKSNQIIPQECTSFGMKKCCDLVKILIEAGADVKISSASGIQPIVNILDFDSPQLVELFLEHGADVNSCDSNGRSVLSLAVWNQKEEIANLLVLKGADVNFMFDRHIPVLAMSVRLGYVELVQKMLEMGADVTKTDNNGNTPLHYIVKDIVFNETQKSFPIHNDISHSTCSQKYDNIAMKRHVYLQSLENTIQEDKVSIATRLEIVKILILAGSNINKVNNKLQSPLHIAIEQNIYVKDKYTEDIKKKTNPNQLHSAGTDKGDILNQPLSECAEQFMEKMFAYNPSDTCFTVTIERNACLQSLEYYPYKEAINIEKRLKILKILFETGCKVNQLNNDLESLLCLAIRHKELVELLIESKADVNLTGQNKQTALHLAASGPEEIVKMLIDAGADVNAEIQETYTTVEADTDIEAIGRENRVREYRYSKKQLFKDIGPKNTTSFEYGETPLHIVARSGEIDSLKHLVTAGASVNALDKRGNSLLSKAIESKSIEKIKYLVEVGASVNVPNKKGVLFDGHVPALIKAVTLNDVELVRNMIKRGADVTQTDRDGNTALHVAVASYKTEDGNSFYNPDYVSKYKTLRSYKKEMLEKNTVVKKQSEMVDILIKAGVSVNQLNHQHESPLLLAASGPAEIVKMLIGAGAYVNDEIQETYSKVESDTAIKIIGRKSKGFFSHKGSGNISYMSDSDNYDTDVESFSDFRARQYRYNRKRQFKDIGPKNTIAFEYGETPLHIAAKSGKIDSSKHLADASVNTLDKNENSSLSKAIESKRIENIKYLVDDGANVNVPNKYGVLPIVDILQFDSVELLKLFVNHGADLNACDKNNNTLLTITLKRKCKEIAMYLIESGADVNVLFDGHVPALSMAVTLDDVELVKKMITHGADVNETDRDGNTSLHVALSIGYDEATSPEVGMFELFWRKIYNCNLNRVKRPKLRFYNYVYTDAEKVLRNRCELVEILIESGASINQTNNALESPLHIAFKVCNLRERIADLSKYDEILTKLINHGAKLNSSILYFCLSNKLFDQAERLLKNSACHLVDEKIRNQMSNIQLSQVFFKKIHFAILQMLVYNGIVLRSTTHVSVSGKTILLTSLMLAIIYGHVDLAKYLLATGYLTVGDLRQLRQFDKSYKELHNIIYEIDTQRTVSTCDLQSLIHEAVSQPWPLVKLAFITVSTMLGEGPERDKRLSGINISPKLKQQLKFQAPVASLPVCEWSKFTMFFDPVVDEAGPEYSLNCWSLDLLYERMKHRLERLKQYTESRVGDNIANVERQLTEDVLKSAFDFRNRRENSKELKLHELEPLVEASIDAIDDCIFFHGNSFDVDCGPKYLVLRSGLQFMIEDFESMQEELSDESSELSESVEFFDERLKSWKNNFGNIGFFENITHQAEQLRRPVGIPSHHTWWFELDF